MNSNILIFISYVISLIIIICVIILFVNYNKLVSNNIIPDNLTLDNLKVNNIEVSNNLISPNIKTKKIYSLDKEIYIDDNIRITKDGIYAPDLVSEGLTTKIIANMNNMRVNNGYIKKFINEDTLSVDEFMNKVNEDKQKYKSQQN